MQPGWPTTGWQWVRLIGNFVNLTTPLGLGVALVGRAQIRRGPRGLFVCEGYRLKFPVADAFTVGSVLTTVRSWDEVLLRHPQLIEHEENHTWQYLYCLGLPFYPAYAVCMGWSMLRTHDRAARNFFERQAGLVIGGYREVPVKPFGETVRALIGRSSGRSRDA